MRTLLFAAWFALALAFAACGGGADPYSSGTQAGTAPPASPPVPPTSSDTIQPSMPTGVVATPGPNQISLTWDASTDDVGVTGYIVRRNGIRIGTTATTSFTDTCVSLGANNRYTVSAIDAAGNVSAQAPGVEATTLVSGTPTALATLAASMQSGEWATFTMGGLNLSVVTAAGPSLPTIVSFAARGQWDCVHKKIQFAGTSHTGGSVIAGAGGLITWDDATNQWSRETYAWSSDGSGPGHGYYHLALNAGNGDLYFRLFGSGKIWRRTYGTTGQNSWQAGQVANEPQVANQVAGGLEWFPELKDGAGGLRSSKVKVRSRR